MVFTIKETNGASWTGNVCKVYDNDGKLRGFFPERHDAEFYVWMREVFAGKLMLDRWHTAFTSALQGGSDTEEAKKAADECVAKMLDGHIADMIAKAIHTQE